MTDFAPNIERVFSLDHHEESYVIEEIEGDVPQFIRGTYYLNGPARFARQNLRYRHWLDGDGMVCTLRFGDQVGFANRFVRSDKFLAEEEANAPSSVPSARPSTVTSWYGVSLWLRPPTSVSILGPVACWPSASRACHGNWMRTRWRRAVSSPSGGISTPSAPFRHIQGSTTLPVRCSTSVYPSPPGGRG